MVMGMMKVDDELYDEYYTNAEHGRLFTAMGIRRVYMSFNGLRQSMLFRGLT